MGLIDLTTPDGEVTVEAPQESDWDARDAFSETFDRNLIPMGLLDFGGVQHMTGGSGAGASKTREAQRLTPLPIDPATGQPSFSYAGRLANPYGYLISAPKLATASLLFPLPGELIPGDAGQFHDRATSTVTGRIPNSDSNVVAWLCGLGGKGSPAVELTGARQRGLDKHDDNLAAAERFAQMMDGDYTDYGFVGQDTFNFLQYMKKLGRDVFNNGKGNGSKDGAFVAKWGALGDLNHQQRVNWADWKSAHCWD